MEVWENNKTVCKKIENKKLRWYIVEDDEYCYVVWASSYSKAKIFLWSNYTWNMDAWESLKHLKCKILKAKVSIEPKKDWVMFEDSGWSYYELLEAGVYFWYEDLKCPTCWKDSSKVYYDWYYYCDNDDCKWSEDWDWVKTYINTKK